MNFQAIRSSWLEAFNIFSYPIKDQTIPLKKKSKDVTEATKQESP